MLSKKHRDMHLGGFGGREQLYNCSNIRTSAQIPRAMTPGNPKTKQLPLFFSQIHPL